MASSNPPVWALLVLVVALGALVYVGTRNDGDWGWGVAAVVLIVASNAVWVWVYGPSEDDDGR